MERSHGELGTRLANGLSGDDSNRFAQINEVIMGKSPAVALAAYGTIGFTGERGTNAQRGDTGSFKAF